MQIVVFRGPPADPDDMDPTFARFLAVRRTARAAIMALVAEGHKGRLDRHSAEQLARATEILAGMIPPVRPVTAPR